MMRGAGTVLTFLSALFFPWPLTALLALLVALSEPWVPLAAGIFADTLYYAHGMPLFALSGALVSALAFFVRSRLPTGSIGG